MIEFIEQGAMRLPVHSLDALMARGLAKLGQRLSARACVPDCTYTYLGSTCNLYPYCYYSMDQCGHQICDCNICP